MSHNTTVMSNCLMLGEPQLCFGGSLSAPHFANKLDNSDPVESKNAIDGSMCCS